jgi:peptide/nickel transport system substrate-binding protein
MKSKKMLVVLISVLVLASLVLSACQSKSTANDPSVIVIGTTDKIASLDAADAYSTHDWEVIENVSNGLVAWKPGTTDLEPALATDLGTVSDDGLVYTFTLKDGIKFGDGTELTATLYAQQLNRLLTIGPSCPNDVADALAVPYIKSIEAPDAKTIVFTLTTPIAYFRNILATSPFVATNPKTFPTDQCVLYPKAPIYGTGPWYVSQFNADEQMVLEPNPYYTGNYKPQVKKIIYRFYSDANTLALAVQSGEVDIAWRMLSTDQISELEKVSGLKIGTIPGGSIRFLTLNLTMAPTDDPNVRKAIAYSIDRNEIADTVFGGKVSPLYSMVPPGFLGAEDTFDTMYASPNLDEARKALEASGYSADKPLELDLWYPPEHYGASTAAWMQIIQKQLEATGEMKVTLQAQEWSTYISALTQGKSYPAAVEGWFFDYPDPSNYLDPFTYNGGMGNNLTAAVKGSTTGTPTNDTVAQLVEVLQKADVELDDTARVAEYKQAQEMAADLAGNIPLFFEAEHVIYRDSISGNANFNSPETLNIGGNVFFNYSMLTKTVSSK